MAVVRPEAEVAIEKGALCSNSDCMMRNACERFWNPDRTGAPQELTEDQLFRYEEEIDECYVQRRTLQGTPEVFRQRTRTTKRHRKAGGEWIQ